VLLVVFVLVTRPGDPTADEVPAPRSTGPFASTEEFVAALGVPDSFALLGEADRSAFTDAEYSIATDFDSACAALTEALRAIEPAFPTLAPKEYAGGGVNRCEAEAPVGALGGAPVRALVLEVNTVAQLYVGDRPAAATTVAPPSTPS
jgi:hypothetical protein